jgi:hypothetical protein
MGKNSKYKVVLKDGSIQRGSDIDHLPGFVKVSTWDGEKRIPVGEVKEIYTSKSETLVDNALMTTLIAALFLLMFIVLGLTWSAYY